MNVMAIGLKIQAQLRKETLIQQTCDAIVKRAGTEENFRTRASQLVTKRLLMRDIVKSDNKFFRFKAKSVGCGVYDITTEEV